ncbi:MAG: hypothetical protein Tsb006_3360 [Rickettsiaceae bacterium]
MKQKSTITKERIAEHLRDRLGFSVSICEDIISQVFSELVELTKRDQKTMLQNFGTWKMNHKKTRPGFNIRTGDAVNIEPRSVLRFSPSKSLKDKINLHDD